MYLWVAHLRTTLQLLIRIILTSFSFHDKVAMARDFSLMIVYFNNIWPGLQHAGFIYCSEMS